MLAALSGEHLPTRKMYIGSAFFAVLGGIIAPAFLVFALTRRPLDLVRDLESLITLVMSPLIAFEIVRSAMSRFVIDESHVSCIAPLGIGSWTMMRAEIERVEANVSTMRMSLMFHSGLQKPKFMPLRKRYRDQFLRQFPELRRARARASIQERKEKRRGKLILLLLALFLIGLVVMLVVLATTL